MKFSPMCVSALLAPVLATAKLSVANRLEVLSEDVDGNNRDYNKKDQEARTNELEVHLKLRRAYSK